MQARPCVPGVVGEVDELEEGVLPPVEGVPVDRSLMSISAGSRRKMAQQNAVTMIKVCIPTTSSAWPSRSAGTGSGWRGRTGTAERMGGSSS